MSLDLDEIRERALLTRGGFYHVVGAYRVMRGADFDALVAEVERLREDAVVARSAETTLTEEVERLRANAEARERFLKREGELLRAVERERDELRARLAVSEKDNAEQEEAAQHLDQVEAVLDGFPVATPCPTAQRVAELRAQRALDNDALARAWDEGRDMERAATVRFLRAEAGDGVPQAEAALLDAADTIERCDHRREETTP